VAGRAADLAHVEALLDATGTLTVATGIVNIWTADAADIARSYHRIEAAHPGRFLDAGFRQLAELLPLT
jgi:alkanesulfonate monooxygenase SsuD/methylene tetrahydromethanopterin reductase-like flavin-dependent oxidoreductase (luciferase family)